MNINIRKETPADYRIVEELTREAFYILQLAELGVRNPVCSLIRSKAGISVYRVECRLCHCSVTPKTKSFCPKRSQAMNTGLAEKVI